MARHRVACKAKWRDAAMALALVGSPVWGQSAAEYVGKPLWGVVVQGVLAPGVVSLGCLLVWAGWAWSRWLRDSSQERRSGLLVGLGALAVWMVLMLSTVLVAQQTMDRLLRNALQRFDFEVNRVESNIQATLERSMAAMRGLRAVQALGVPLGELALEQWGLSRELEQETPGLRAIGVVQATANQNANGGQALTMRSVAFVPKADRLILAAWDWGSDFALQEAALKAARSGRAALSTQVPLSSADDQGAVLLAFLPVYDAWSIPPTPAQRLERLQGFVVAVLDFSVLLAGSGAEASEMLHFSLREVADGQAGDVVFTNTSTRGPTPAAFLVERDLLSGQRFFRLNAYSTPEFEQSVELRYIHAIAFLGASLALLFSLGAALILGARQRATRLASQMTQEVARLARVVRSTSNSVVLTDEHGAVAWMNSVYAHLSGRDPLALGSISLLDMLGADGVDGPGLVAVELALRTREPLHQRLCWNQADTVHHLDTEIQALFDDAGAHTGFMVVGQDVSAQVRTEVALARERERADGILLGSNVGTWQYNFRTGEALVNAQWWSMLGATAEAHGDSPEAYFRSHVKPEDLVRVDNLMELCRSGEAQRFDTQFRVQRPGGAWDWILSRGVVLSYSQDGAPEWIAGIHMDITEQRHIEDRLRDMEAFLNRAGRAAGVGAWQIDLSSKRLVWSDLSCEIFGEVPGHSPTLEHSLSYFSQEDRERLLQAMEQAPLSLMGWDYTLAAQTADDRSIWVRTVGEVEFDDSGPVRLVGAIQDVTAMRQSQDQLVKTMALLQQVLDSVVQVGIIAVDMQRVVTVFNRGAELLLGYSAEEVVGCRSATHFFEPLELEAFKAMQFGPGEVGAQEVFDGLVRHSEKSEWNFVRKDGSRVQVSFLIAPMQDPGGQVSGHIGVAYDLTKQKAIEAALLSAKMSAEDTSRAKSQFLANMSHELRTPMNAILGMAQLLQGTALNREQADYVEKAYRAAKSLLGLLNDILDFSKVEAGRMELDPQPFELDELLCGLSTLVSVNAVDKALDIRFDIDPRVCGTLLGDSMRLHQVLLNLLGNAIKFTSKGEVCLTVSQHERTHSAMYVRFAVRDTGIGISTAQQSRVFDAFTQAEASTTRKYGGTGLGLAICHRVVALMGGTLTVHSEAGMGSEFSFVIPLQWVEGAAADTAPRRVLMAPGSEQEGNAWEKLLTVLGWSYEVALNGEDARRRLQMQLTDASGGWDVVLANMQQVDGWGWDILRAAPRSVTRVLVSSWGRERLTGQHPNALHSVDSLVLKPVCAGSLRRAVMTPSVPGSDNAEAATPLKGMRILLVEDNPINQQVAVKLLSRQGARVEAAENGQLAVDRLAAEPQGFDLVLMDMQMPVMDGLEATRAIRTTLGLQSLPIVAMTANAMAADREACLQAGMNEHVGKPFDVQHLVKLLCQITQWVEGAASRQTALEIEPRDSEAEFLALAWPAGLEVGEALRRMGGSLSVYRHTLGAFLAQAPAVGEQLSQALAETDVALACRLAHSFKGLSATVGAKEVSLAAEKVEQVLKSDPAKVGVEVRGALIGLEQCVQGLLLSLQALQPELEPGVEPPPGQSAGMAVPVDETYQALVALRGKLAQENWEAVEDFATWRTAPELFAMNIAPLEAAMADLDFEAATAACDVLVQGWKGAQA